MPDGSKEAPTLMPVGLWGLQYAWSPIGPRRLWSVKPKIFNIIKVQNYNFLKQYVTQVYFIFHNTCVLLGVTISWCIYHVHDKYTKNCECPLTIMKFDYNDFNVFTCPWKALIMNCSEWGSTHSIHFCTTWLPFWSLTHLSTWPSSSRTISTWNFELQFRLVLK